MRRVLIAAVATLGLAGIAAAQEAPVSNGYYGYAQGAAPQNGPLDSSAGRTAQAPGVDYSVTTSSYRTAAPAQDDAASTMELARQAHR